MLDTEDFRAACQIYRIAQESLSLESLVKANWETETFGCKYQYDTPRSPEDRKA